MSRPTNDFLPRMRGSNGVTAGRRGIVPKPAIADNVKYLKGDGTWSALANASAATAAEAAAGTSSTTFVTPALAAIAAAPAVNARAPRQALAFDGTASTRVYSTLTNQNIGTDAYSLVTTLRIPTTAPTTADGVLCLSASATTADAASSLEVSLQSSGALRFTQKNSANTGGIYSDVSGVLAAFSGKVITLAVTRNGTTLAAYINGVAQTVPAGTTYGSSPGDFSQTVASTYLLIGFAASAYVWRGPIYAASLYNLALSAADVTEIYELGGAVPERFKFGSQVSKITGDDSTFASDTAFWSRTAGVTISGGKLVFSGAAGGDNANRAALLARGKAYTLNFEITTRSTGSIGIYDGATYQAFYDTTGTKSLAFTSQGTQLYFLNYAGAVPVFAGEIDNATLIQRGAVCHFDADLDGIGYQLHDQSTNKLHALLTTTGVAWTKAATMGYVKVLSDGTTAAQALGGGTVLPANCQIVRVRARSITGTPSITLGTSSGGSQIVASVALSPTWQTLTIALTGGINTAAASLWMTASTANVVEVQLAYEQLPA